MRAPPASETCAPARGNCVDFPRPRAYSGCMSNTGTTVHPTPSRARALASCIILSFMAGLAISLGGTVFLRVKDAFPGGTVVGSFLFAVGLFIVCTRSYSLFTGKLCYVLDNKPAYAAGLLLIWLGNLLGCMFMGCIENATAICGDTGINATAMAMAQAKMDGTPLSLFVLGIICNIFMYIAVNGYRGNPHQLGKYLAIIFGVMGFICAGSEHSIADMYYFCVSGAIYSAPLPVFKALLFISLGNLVGGNLLPVLEAANRKLSKGQE